MKIIFALAALVSATFGLEADQITCLPDGAGISIQLADSDYPKYAGADRASLGVGSCAFAADGSLSAGADCGVAQDVQGSTIINSAVIKSAPATGLITRKPTVEISVACTYNTASKQSAQSFINPNLEAIKGDLAGTGEYNLELNIVDADGNAITGPLDVNVDEVVTATISGAGAGLQARATKCWATPAADTTDAAQTYVLMEDGCAIDPTFGSNVDVGTNQQSLTFRAFAWTAEAGGPVFLHCDLEASAVGSDSGVCQTRKRRSLMKKKMQKNMMKKLLVH